MFKKQQNKVGYTWNTPSKTDNNTGNFIDSLIEKSVSLLSNKVSKRVFYKIGNIRRLGFSWDDLYRLFHDYSKKSSIGENADMEDIIDMF